MFSYKYSGFPSNMNFYDFVIILGDNLHLTLSRMVGLFGYIIKKKRGHMSSLNLFSIIYLRKLFTFFK